MLKIKKPLLLVICDGLGLRKEKDGNAWAQAKTPVLDNLLKSYPNSKLKASGEAVGLPVGQIGNSEVGHLTIGAGRVVYTGLPLINKSIEDKSFLTNKAILEGIKKSKESHSNIHVMGLLSPGGVHSQEEHLYAILEMLKQHKADNVYLHAFGDGRDVAPQSITASILRTEKVLNECGYKWGSISGRYYAMDRDQNFERTMKAYNAICNIDSPTFTNPLDFIKSEYAENITDEFLTPTSATNNPGLKKNDVVIFFNFRPDRARQLTHLFVNSKLYKYPAPAEILKLWVISLMKYPEVETHVAFPDIYVKNPIGKVLEDNHLKQLRVAETEKYAHVTFFFDGGKEENFKDEEKVIIPSLKIASFDLAPQMSAKLITDKIIGEMNNFNVTITNFANPDMVGHTGIMSAAIKAMEVLDEQLGRIVEYIAKIDGVMFLTADHGNVEIMMDENGKPATKHTTSLVPLICTDRSIKLEDGALSDVAPTILKYLDIKIPKEMTGKSLVKE